MVKGFNAPCVLAFYYGQLTKLATANGEEIRSWPKCETKTNKNN